MTFMRVQQLHHTSKHKHLLSTIKVYLKSVPLSRLAFLRQLLQALVSFLRLWPTNPPRVTRLLFFSTRKHHWKQLCEPRFTSR